MTLTISIIIIILVLVFVLLRRQKRESNSSVPSTQRFEHSDSSDIQFFLKILRNYDKVIELELQNEIYKFNISKQLLESFQKHDVDNNIRRMLRDINQTNGIHRESATILFDSNHPDGEGPGIITDKFGKIYWFYHGFGKPKIEYLTANIWELLMPEKDLVELIKGPDEVIKINNSVNLAKLIDDSRVLKFGIHGFYIEDYEDQLKTLFEQSNGNLTLKNFQSDSLGKDLGSTVNIELNINEVKFEFQIEKSKWYDFNFPNVINGFLIELKSEFMLCLVHENGWDETHGILLGSKEEFALLLNNKLIRGS
ncbi:hypothetical protein ABWH96_20640 [Marivirga tractuosa]|uniref:hypothetical protein n=1 Tax=Marivirga tractuosa TaxID=1006 RepID=UPI0035D09DDB